MAQGQTKGVGVDGIGILCAKLPSSPALPLEGEGSYKNPLPSGEGRVREVVAIEHR
jgi:hypothetical protein